ncbi:MAG: MATE family efflux transporter [Ruminococcus sp.]|nr:MATE family efflux transporter [Ruminococcus sp.]
MNQKDKMRSMPVKKLILSMGIPMVLSMMLQAVYNIVDSAFVSNIQDTGELALNALTLAFPLQLLIVAIGIGTGVGCNALLSKSLGQGNIEKASKVAGNGMFLALIIYIIFLIFGIFGTDLYISSQTKNPIISKMAIDYLKVCCIASFGIIFFSIFEKLLQGTGHSMYSTIAQIVGAVINVILDPIMIYGYFGCPKLEVKGAAYATVIGQIASFILALIFHFKVNTNISNGLKYIKPSAIIIKQIYAIGLPAIISQALLSIMTYALNIILVSVDEALVTAYGLYYKIQQFILFAGFGLRDAITPIISFSHGMEDKKRIDDGIKFGMVYTIAIMSFGLILVEILAIPFSNVFGLSGVTQQYCISAMRIVSISFIFAGMNITYQGIFQALNGGIQSLIVSVCRQFIFVIPIAWIFSLIAKHSLDLSWLIWTTFIIAETISVIIAHILMKRLYNKEVNDI